MNKYLVVTLIAVIAIFLSRGQRFYVPSAGAVTPARLAKVLEGTEDKVLLYFWQPSDDTCKRMDPLIAQVVAENPKKVTLVKIDTSNPENKAVHDAYDVRATPTFIVVKKGKVGSTWVGPFKDKAQVISFLRPSGSY
jgi:thioredoxin-like negative regulator of GroEL